MAVNDNELDSYTAELMTLICEDVADESEGGTGLWTNVERDGFDPRSGYLQVDGNINLRRIALLLAEQGWTLTQDRSANFVTTLN